MGLFKKKADPISDRSRALQAEIDALEAQIRSLDSRLHESRDQPRLRSTAMPNGSSAPGSHPASRPLQDPVFESARPHRPGAGGNAEETLRRKGDLGTRKYDFAGLWKRLQNQFRGPPATNPKLISYLAAGSIKGLRPLRYEKRIARNRFIALLLFLFLILWGIFAVFFKG